MAQLIRVDGPDGQEGSYHSLSGSLLGKSVCKVKNVRLQDGRTMLSRLDATELNKVATDLAGVPIYGDAIVFQTQERFNG
jgi:hypothetical protein